MCDPLSRNMPSDLQTIPANCLAHGRRAFVDIVDHFPQECLHVLQAFKAIYKNDEIARRDGLSPEQRLAFHQTHSQPVMDDLKKWLDQQLVQHLVEAG
jgi:transposase